MESHEWMIKYTRQTEWIDKRGLFLWLALYTGGLGGGLYLVALYFNSLPGIILSWFIVAVLKGGFHLAFLGKPWRFFRIITRPQSSWLARGFILVISFVVLGAMQIIISISLPGTMFDITFKILTGVTAFGVAIYTGFVLNNIISVPFWNSLLLPIIFLVCGITGGLGIVSIIALYTGNANLHIIERTSHWFLAANVLLIVIYLWNASEKGAASRKSVMEILNGNASYIFWGGVVISGVIIPLLIVVTSCFLYHNILPISLIGIICEVTGGMALRYCVLKAGIYQPLLPESTPYQR